MKTGIHIGAEKGAVIEARKAVLEILKQPVDGSVKIAAFNALTAVCAVNGVVSGCTVTGR